MDVRIVNNDGGVITAATLEKTPGWRKPVHVALVNVSGDLYNAGGGASSGGDGAIVDGSNSAIRATVKQYADSNPIAVVLVNASGDAYNGNSSSVTVNKWNLTPTQDSVHIDGGITGVSGDVSTIPKAGSTWPVSVAATLNTAQQGVVGVQIVGGGIGGTFSPSGDLYVNQRGTWASSITGDVLLRANPGVVIGQLGATVGVQVIGGISSRVSVSGDVLAVTQSGAWVQSIGIITAPVGVTGDVSTKPASGQTWQVEEQNVIGVILLGRGGGTDRVGISGDTSAPFHVDQRGGWANSITGDVLLRKNATNTPIGTLSTPVGVQVVGGGVNRVSISGDVLAVSQQGPWATSVTGDVLLRQNASNTPIGTLSTAIGVQIVGGGVNRVSISGDTLAVSQQGLWNVNIGLITTPIGVTGDVSTIPKSGQIWPVKEQNVLGVQIVGVGGGLDRVGISGDAPVSQKGAWAVSISGDSRIPTTYSGRVTSAGSTQICGPYTNKVVRVTRYSLQADADNTGTTQSRFGSGASGSPLTPDWMLNPREGVVEAVSGIGGGCLFETAVGVGLFIENSGSPIRYSVTFMTGDSA